MNASQRRQRAQIGAYTVHSRYDSRKLTAPARKAFLDRFEVAVDPERELSPAERNRRAAAARSAYFRQLAMKSAQKRRTSQPTRTERGPGALPASERTRVSTHSEQTIQTTAATE